MHARFLSFTLLVLLAATHPVDAQHGTAKPARSATARVSRPAPFHLEAVFRQSQDSDFTTQLTMDWVSPHRWRRVLESKDYSQTTIVNGDQVEEQRTSGYMPLELQVLMDTLLQPLLHTPKSPVARLIHANSAQSFLGQTIPDVLMLQRGEGNGSAVALITGLVPLVDPPDSLFAVEHPTIAAYRLQAISLTEPALLKRLPRQHVIIWPQILDGRQIGRETFLISVDAQGHLQQALPMVNVNSRANDSAIRQMQRWTFEPIVQGGSPTQFSAIYSVAVNTRAYGPQEPLTDAEVRQLAEKIVAPILPPDIPSGSSYTQAVAIDSDGVLVEMIGGGGEATMSGPCYDALRQWKFKPMMEKGQPRPYRASITCKAP